MLPWKFFNLTPRDMSGELIRTFNKTADSNVLAGSNPSVSFQVPADRVCIVTGCSASFLSGGDAPEQLQVSVNEVGTAPLSLILAIPMTRAPGLATNNWTSYALTYFIAGPGTTIDFTIVTATTASFQGATFGMSAFLIPRGDATYL